MHPQRFRRVTTALCGWKARLKLSQITPTRWIVVLVGLSFALQLSGLSHTGTAAADGEEVTMQRATNQTVELAQRAPARHERGSVSADGSGFIENLGQFDPAVQFQMATEDGYLIVGDDALWIVSDTPLPADEAELQVETVLPEGTPTPDASEAMEAARAERNRLAHVKVQFPDAAAPLSLEPFDPVEGSVSYLKGNDPEQWVSDVPIWRGVRIHDLAPGYALEVSGADGSWAWKLLETDQAAIQGFEEGQPSSPEAALSLQLSLAGADSFALEGDSIVAEVEGQLLEVQLPEVVAEDGTTAGMPEARLEGTHLRLEIAAPDPAGSESGLRSPESLVHHPILGVAALTDPGTFLLSSRPGRSNTQLEPQPSAQEDALLYSLLLGGGWNERAHGMALHPTTGEVYVTGRSEGFPLLPDNGGPVVEGVDDVYLLRLSPLGEHLSLTYVGGNRGDDAALDIVVLESGQSILLGRTGSEDFPTTANGFQRDRSGLIDAFVIMLSPSTVGLEYGSFFGGIGFDYAYGLEGDPDRPTRIYFTGMTTSTEDSFPLRNPIDGVHDGIQDAYLVQFDVSRSGAAALEFSTYLGGSDSDQGHDIAFGPDGTIYVTGQTHSDDFLEGLAPARGFDRSYNGLWDSFLVGVDPASRAVSFGSYLGGEGQDCERAGDFRECRIVVDPTGLVYLAGMTGSDPFPTTTGVYQRDNRGADDIYITVLEPALDGQAALVRSTLAGGSGDDLAFGLAVSGAGQPVVVGRTTSDDLELTQENAIRTAFAGGHEAFALAFSSDFSRLLYGTYIGGDSPDGATPVLIDPSGNLHVGGFTFSSDFQVTHGDDEIDGISDAFVVGIDPELPAGAAVSVEVVDPDGDAVSALELNSDGWPTPNPLTVTVTITCPPGGISCSSPIDLELSGAGIGRYYVYEATLLPDEHNCAGDSPAQQTSYSSFSVSCENLTVQAGRSSTHVWRVWVQPSEASTLEGRATFGQDNDQAIVHVPQAQIHPVVVIPGLMGSMKQGGEWVADPIFHTYDTLIEELRLVGYEDGISLFTFAYDWRQHLPDTGEELGQAITGFLKSASRAERSYVLADSVDLVGHSLGGLVSRAYVQSNSYGNDVHRLITLGTPHLGAPKAYLAAEGLEFDEFPKGFLFDRVLRSLALKHGYCTIFIVLPGCIVTDADLHAYIEEQAPSARQIFPDKDYLPEAAAGYLVSPESDMDAYPFGVQVNTFLENLNRDIGLLFGRLGSDAVITFAGVQGSDQTPVFYRVVKPFFWESPLWDNGKVPGRDEFRPESRGDGTVPLRSADLRLVDNRAQTIIVETSDNAKVIVHDTMPTQLQQSISQTLTGTRPPFDAGFDAPGFDPKGAALIVNLSPVEVLITDPLGRSIGVDFQTGEDLNEIPGAFFGRSDLFDEPDFLFIPNAPEGVYRVDLLGVAEGEYRVRMEFFDAEGATVAGEVSGVTLPGERHNHTLTLTHEILPDLPMSVEWRPPLGPSEEPVQINRQGTLPIRFRVHDAAGSFVRDEIVLVWVAEAEDPSAVLAAFTTEQPGNRGTSDIVRIDPEDEQYIVNLHLRDYPFEPGSAYTINVMIYGRQIMMTAFTVTDQPGPIR